YCHTGVEKGAVAGVPPVQTCMSCHSQIWTNSPLLEPIRQSYNTETPLKGENGEIGWNRGHKLPDFVYFNHNIPISRGISCNGCHGPVQTMQLTYKGKPFFMRWCLECHRDPERFIGERKEVFNVYAKYQAGKIQAEEHVPADQEWLAHDEESLMNDE